MYNQRRDHTLFFFFLNFFFRPCRLTTSKKEGKKGGKKKVTKRTALKWLPKDKAQIPQHIPPLTEMSTESR
jgi:hypothetical protein